MVKSINRGTCSEQKPHRPRHIHKTISIPRMKSIVALSGLAALLSVASLVQADNIYHCECKEDRSLTNSAACCQTIPGAWLKDEECYMPKGTNLHHVFLQCCGGEDSEETFGRCGD